MIKQTHRRMDEPAIKKVLRKYDTLERLGGVDVLPKVPINDAIVGQVWTTRLNLYRTNPIGFLCECEVCAFIMEEADSDETQEFSRS